MKNETIIDNKDNKILEPEYTMEFSLSSDDYQEYNELMLEDMIDRKKKKSSISSFILMFLSIVLGSQIIVAKRYNEYILDFLVTFVFLISIYNFFFYRKILPQNLKKYSKKIFPNSRFAKGNIKLDFFTDYFTEVSHDGEVILNYNDITQKKENCKLLVLLTNKQHIVIINKSNLNPDILNFIDSKLAFLNTSKPSDNLNLLNQK